MKPAERMAGIAFFSMLLLFASAMPMPAAAAEVELSSAQRAAPAAVENASPATSVDKDTEAYQKRESQHPQAANFRGGDGAGIYIGGSAGLLIVVLLVILLLR